MFVLLTGFGRVGHGNLKVSRVRPVPLHCRKGGERAYVFMMLMLRRTRHPVMARPTRDHGSRSQSLKRHRRGEKPHHSKSQDTKHRASLIQPNGNVRSMPIWVLRSRSFTLPNQEAPRHPS